MPTTTQAVAAVAAEPRPRRLTSRVSTTSCASSDVPSPTSPAESFASSHRSSTFSGKPSSHRPGPSPDPTTPHSSSEPLITGPTSPSLRPGQHNRHSSAASATSTYSSKSNGKSGQESKAVLAKKDRTNDGTYTRCGRHGDEWLFGDWSITATVKKLFKNDEEGR